MKNIIIRIFMSAILLLTSSYVAHAVPDKNSNPDIDVWPRFWQWESPWDTDHYAGRADKPFKDHGCHVTAFAMLLNYHGIKWIPNEYHYPKVNPACKDKEEDPYYCNILWSYYIRNNPGTLNKWMIDNDIYHEYDSKCNGKPCKIVAFSQPDFLKKFYVTNAFRHDITSYVKPNYSCQPVGKGSCYQLTWGKADTEKLLDHDLLNGRPDIMQINWTGPNREGIIKPHPSHFVLIGGYSWEDESYRVYDTNQRYNESLQYPPGIKKIYSSENRLSYNSLRIDRYTPYTLIYPSLPNRSSFWLWILSPIEVQIFNKEGEMTGFDSVSGERITEIPYSSYSEESESTIEADGSDEPKKTFFMDTPPPGNYILKIFGTGDGPYTIKMQGTTVDGTTNLDTSITGTASLGLRETYRIKYSPTGEASLSHDNQPPLADAGSSQTGEQGYEIKLDGSVSNDPDGDPLKYTWTLVAKPTGSQVALSDPGIAQPTFTPDIPGTYVLQLAVNDYFTDSLPSTVTITALPIKSRIAVEPNLATPLHAGPGFIAFDVTNTGRAGVSSGRIDASLADPGGAVVWSGSQNFTLPVGQTSTVQIPATVPLLKFGNYTLTFAQSDETRPGLPATTVIPNSASGTFSFDKLAYRVRETAKLTVTLANTGRFDLANTTVTLTSPAAGYLNTRTLSAWQGEALQYDLPIPPAISSGQHDVTVTLTLPSGSAVAFSTKLTVPQSALRLGHAGPRGLQAGDALTLTIANPGGVDTNYTTENLLVTDANGIVLLQENVTGSVLSGEEKTLVDLSIPLQSATGAAQLYAKLIDGKTGRSSSLKVPLEISGLAASLSARTEKDLYLNTEPAMALATVATGAVGIDDGQLDVRIKRYTPFKEEKFTDFLPKNWWPFSYPEDVVVAPDGFVYVADGDRIAKFDGNGNSVAMWGDGELGYARGIAVSQDGYVYVADSSNNCIWKYFNDGTLVAKWGTYGSGDGQFNWPSKVTVSLDGIVYVSDSYNHRIQKFDVNGNYLGKWGEQGEGVGQFLWPWGIGVNTEGDVFVIDGGCTMSYCNDHHRVLKFDRNGNYISQWGGRGSGDGQFDTPWGLTIGPDGSIYVADSDNSRVQRFDANGNFLGKWGSYGLGDGEFDWFTGISAGTDGTVYVADSYNRRLQRFDGSGNFLGKWGQEFAWPSGVALGGDASIYVADTGNDRIMKYNRDGDYVSSIGASGAGDGVFSTPEDVAVSHDGFVYVVDTGNHRIHKFDPSGNFILRWGASGSGWGSPGSDDGLFHYPMAVAVAPNNTVYVVDYGNHRVQQFDADGHFLAKFGGYGSAAGQFKDPRDIAVASDGSVYVVDSSNQRVQKFDSAGNFLTQWGQGDDWWAKIDGKFLSPRSIAVSTDGSVYVGSDSRIQKFDGNGNFLAKWEDYGSDPGQFYAADGLAVGTDGTLYLSDRSNNRIERTRQVVVSADEEIVRQENIPLSQMANSTQDYTKNFSALSIPGKYYLEERLINRLDQGLATAEYPFYVTAGNTALEFATDKTTYKPGEVVTITGRVGNLSAISAASLLLDLSANDSKIFTTTFDVPAGEYQYFTATTIAGAEGSVALSGRVSQNDSVLVETSDRYQVAVPHLSLSISGPAVVGRSPFEVNVAITNTGAFDFSGQLSLIDGQGEIDQQSLVLPAGKTWRHDYPQQISQSKTYTVNVTGDLAQTASTTVGYGEAVLIYFGVQSPAPPPRTERETQRPPEKPPAPSPAPTYIEGNIGIPVTITNTGQLSEQLAVNYVLSNESGVLRTESRSYYLQPGESVSDRLDFDLTKGSYLLAATSDQPFAAAQFPFAVTASDIATMTTAVGSQDGSGLIPLTMTVANGGHNTISGTIAVAVMSNAGKALWRGEVIVNDLAPLVSGNYVVYVDTAGIISGVYQTDVSFYNASGRKLAGNVVQLRIPGPIFEIVSMPNQPIFTVGKVAHLSFAVKNTGAQSGTARFTVKALEWLNEFCAVTLGPGEEESTNFSFTLPEDVEEGDYLVDYALTPVDSQASNGQVPFHVADIKLAVTATLDKVAYKTGDTAILELEVAKQGQFEDGEYIAIIRYGAYLDMKPVMLTATPAVVTFSVPLPKITGEGLFYSIHFASGRTIHQNMLPINRAQADLVIDELSAAPGALTNERLQASVLNNGELPTPATMVAFYDGDPHSEHYVVIGRQAIPALLPGQAAAAVIDWNISGKAGTHALYVVADPDDLVTERSEANNIRSIDVLIPAFTLGVSTLQTQYQANQNVGIVQTVANLNAATVLNSPQLSTTINGPSGSAVTTYDDNIQTLAPGETSFARSWDTATNMPGLYRVEAELKQSATILAAAFTTFEILPSVLIDGSVALPNEAVRGFPLDVGYALVNKGNIDLDTGEVEAFFTKKESDFVAASFVQPFGQLPVLAEVDGAIHLATVELDPGEYMVRIKARSSGEEYLIGEKELRVLPPIEVVLGESTAPRVLVLLGKPGTSRDTIANERMILRKSIISQTLEAIDAYYRIVENRDEFKQEMRSGIFNLFVLASGEPLVDHVDAELKERVFSGDGLILLDYDHLTDSKLKDILAARSLGYLPDAVRTLTMIENGLTGQGELPIIGKVEKLSVLQESDVIASIADKGVSYPGIIDNSFGRGTVITFAFDVALSAQGAEETVAYRQLLADAVIHGAPKEVETIPGVPFGIEWTLKSVGQTFAIKVQESQDSALNSLFTYPTSSVQEGTISWEFNLSGQKIERLVHLVKLPEQGGSFVIPAEIYYLNDGSYIFYNNYSVNIFADGLTTLEMAILTELQSINDVRARNISTAYQSFMRRFVPNRGKKELESEIHSLLILIKSTEELAADTTGLRRNLGKLLKIFERRWVEAGR